MPAGACRADYGIRIWQLPGAPLAQPPMFDFADAVHRPLHRSATLNTHSASLSRSSIHSTPPPSDHPRFDAQQACTPWKRAGPGDDQAPDGAYV